MDRLLRLPCMVIVAVLAGCAPIRPMGGGGVVVTANDCNTTSGKCEVYVSVTEPCMTAGNIKADPAILELAGKPERTLVWHLPDKYAFCRRNGDQVQFKNGSLDFQFYGPAYTNNGDGSDDATAGDCKSKFRWKDRNEKQTKGVEYGYYLQFTGPNGKCYFDPFIRNG